MPLDLATLRDHLAAFELAYGCRAFVMLACADGSDEHWQIWHPDHLDMPVAVIVPELGVVERHPDSPVDTAKWLG